MVTPVPKHSITLLYVAASCHAMIPNCAVEGELILNCLVGRR